MITAPLRPTAPARPAASSRAAAAEPTPSASADAVAPEAEIESEIASLLAHEPTPEDLALQRQGQAFDFIARVRAENERETNALRDMAMQQMKNDDELLKKWIELI